MDNINMDLYYLTNDEKDYFSYKKNNLITTKPIGQCINTNTQKKVCEPNSDNGYNRPLNEQCVTITGQLNSSPDKSCSAVWNNLTRRKTLIIKDNRNNNIL